MRNNFLRIGAVLLVQSMIGVTDELPGVTKSWLGNTWGGVYDGIPSEKYNDASRRRGSMQMEVDAMAVAPETGMVLVSASWDESQKKTGLYLGGDNGAVEDLGWLGETSTQWNNVHVDGGAVAVTEDYWFVTVSEGSVRRYRRSTGQPDGPDVLVSPGKIPGLATLGDALYIADAAAERIRVYNIHTMTEMHHFDDGTDVVGRLTVDGDGNIWSLTQRKLRKHSPSGTWLLNADLPSGTQAVDVNYNSVTNQVMIADNGPDQNIKFFHPSDGTYVGYFGAVGGLRSSDGGAPGEWTPGRFHHPANIASDLAGNLYVGMNEQNSADLESYTADGTFRWATRNHGWITTAVPDPDDENSLYGPFHRYTMDYSKRGAIGNEAGEWKTAAYTMDHFAYPEDVRAIRFRPDASLTPLKMVKLNGQKFLFMTSQTANWLVVYRFEGEIAIPCSLMRMSANKGISGWPDARSSDDDFIWTDTGNGAFEAAEYEYPPYSTDAYAVDVDENGDVWLGKTDGTILCYRFSGCNSTGSPIYNTDNCDVFQAPAKWTYIGRILVDATNQRIGIMGFTADYPNQADDLDNALSTRTSAPIPGAAGRVFTWYHWDGNGVIANELWSLEDLEFRDKPNEEEKHGWMMMGQADMAGDYLFLQHINNDTWNALPDTHYTDIYRLKDGQKVGHLQPGGDVSLQVAIIDAKYGMRAFQRSDGEYMVFLEDIRFGKTIMYRWQAPLMLEAENCVAFSGCTVDSKVRQTSDNGWLRFDNVNLLDSYGVFTARYAKGSDDARSLEIRADALDGPLLGVLSLENTGSWNTYAETSTELYAGMGITTLYLVFKGGNGAGNFDEFRFEMPAKKLEAEQADLSEGCTVDTAIRQTQQNGWAAFRNIDFTHLQPSISVSYAKGNDTERRIEFRLDSPSGNLIGELIPENTGGWNTYVTGTFATTATEELHDLYLVFKEGSGAANIDSITLGTVGEPLTFTTSPN